MLTVEKTSLFSDSMDIKSLYQRLERNKKKDAGLTYEWISSLWESHFGKSDKLTLIIKDSQDVPLGIVPLYVSKENVKRLKLRILRPISGLYSTSGGLAILGNEYQALAELFHYIGKRQSWDIFEVYMEAGTPLESALKSLIETKRLKSTSANYESSPYIDLRCGIKDFLSSKTANFRSNLKRKEKKLLASGSVNLVICTDIEDVQQSLSEIFQIENKSWKLQTSTAITSVERRKAFYSILAERCARAGWLRIYVLKLNGIPIAFDYGLLFQKRYFMLKTSYVEEFSKLSPGIALRWYVVKDLFELGCLEHDFLWGTEPYKLQWSNGLRKFNIYKIYNRTPHSMALFYMKKALRYFQRKDL